MLPDETRVWPGHDYRGHSASTIGEEKRFNPRLAGKSREEFVLIMQELSLPPPKKIDIAVPANLACGRGQHGKTLQYVPGILQVGVGRGRTDVQRAMPHAHAAQLVQQGQVDVARRTARAEVQLDIHIRAARQRHALFLRHQLERVAQFARAHQPPRRKRGAHASWMAR